MTNPLGTQGITEQDIANYLIHNPGFFERHAELLGTIQLANPHGVRAVSLQERQMQMLRDRIKGLEQRIVEMIRHGQENVTLNERLHRWAAGLLEVAHAHDLPDAVVQGLRHEFMIPQAALRVWDIDATYATGDHAQTVGEEVRAFAQGLAQPYCGAHTGFEAVRWLQEPHSVQSVAMMALRSADQDVFGLLILGSPDPTRYSADMGTDLLERIAHLAASALCRMRSPD